MQIFFYPFHTSFKCCLLIYCVYINTGRNCSSTLSGHPSSSLSKFLPGICPIKACLSICKMRKLNDVLNYVPHKAIQTMSFTCRRIVKQSVPGEGLFHGPSLDRDRPIHFRRFGACGVSKVRSLQPSVSFPASAISFPEPTQPSWICRNFARP